MKKKYLLILLVIEVILSALPIILHKNIVAISANEICHYHYTWYDSFHPFGSPIGQNAFNPSWPLCIDPSPSPFHPQVYYQIMDLLLILTLVSVLWILIKKLQ